MLRKFVSKLRSCFSVFKTEDLSDVLQRGEAQLSSKNIVLSLVHVNPVTSIGGVQRYLFEDAQSLSSNGIDSIHIFPVKRCLTYSYSISVNNKLLTKNMSFVDVFAFVKKVSDGKLTFLALHHIIGWKLVDVRKLMSITHRNILFVHDTYLLDPVVFSRKIAYKGYNESNLLDDKQVKFIVQSSSSIVFPSLFLRDKFIKESRIFGEARLKSKVEPNLLTSSCVKRKTRLAFLGYPAEHKGWGAFQTLLSNTTLMSIYEFYHVGADSIDSCNIRQIRTDYKRLESRAENILQLYDIDIVFLWSMLEESYSYTMYEAAFANAFIITNKISGNISHEVMSGVMKGMCFDDLDQVINFLLNEAPVSSRLSTAIPKPVLVHNSAIYNIFRGDFLC